MLYFLLAINIIRVTAEEILGQSSPGCDNVILLASVLTPILIDNYLFSYRRSDIPVPLGIFISWFSKRQPVHLLATTESCINNDENCWDLSVIWFCCSVQIYKNTEIRYKYQMTHINSHQVPYFFLWLSAYSFFYIWWYMVK